MNERIYGHRWSSEQLQRVEKVWEVLSQDFFQNMIDDRSHVLDVGCGFCHFLNHIRAAERVGVDANPAAAQYAKEGVTFVQTADLSLAELPSNHFDFVLISNFLEHLNSSDDVLALLSRVRELLAEGGRVAILQPNFRLLGARYFDFIDHKTILTDASMREALECCGLTVEKTIVRFLPYTTKSHLPTHPLLVRWYLRFPPAQWLLGKQSFFLASRRDRAEDVTEA